MRAEKRKSRVKKCAMKHVIPFRKLLWGSVRAQRKKKRDCLWKSLEISSNLGIISGLGSFQRLYILTNFAGFLTFLEIKKSKMANSIWLPFGIHDAIPSHVTLWHPVENLKEKAILNLLVTSVQFYCPSLDTLGVTKMRAPPPPSRLPHLLSNWTPENRQKSPF